MYSVLQSKAGKIDSDGLPGRRRPAANDQNEAGELDGLVHVVGDKEDRLALGFPDPHDKDLARPINAQSVWALPG
jgi:hypothetical protein